MSFFERIGLKKNKPKTQLESEIEAMEEINSAKLNEFLADKSKLDLFNQVNATWLFKSGRWTK